MKNLLALRPLTMSFVQLQEIRRYEPFSRVFRTFLSHFSTNRMCYPIPCFRVSGVPVADSSSTVPGVRDLVIPGHRLIPTATEYKAHNGSADLQSSTVKEHQRTERELIPSCIAVQATVQFYYTQRRGTKACQTNNPPHLPHA